MTRVLYQIRRFERKENGSTLAELAILVPFLIVMVAAVTELGRFFQTYSTLTKSTRAAARYLSNVAYAEPYLTNAKKVALCGKTDCTGRDPVVAGLKLDDIVVTPEYTAGGGGNPITVTVSVNHQFAPIFDIGKLLHNGFSLALPVKPSTTMYYMWTEPAGAEE